MTGRPDERKNYWHLIKDVRLDSRNRIFSITLMPTNLGFPEHSIKIRYEDLTDLTDGIFSVEDFLKSEGWKISTSSEN